MYDIPEVDDQFITDNFENGPFVSGETDLIFTSGAWIDKNVYQIFNSVEDLVLEKKEDIGL